MKTTLSRVRRSVTIMGRRMGEALSFAQLLYIPMQVADIFSLKVNLAHGGMDQRKAHVIAIDVGESVGGYKPIAVHHHLLTGISVDEQTRKGLVEARARRDREAFEESLIKAKMSKSKPESAIFIHDSPSDIKRKIRKAFCPPREAEFNPVLELARYVVFRDRKEPLTVVNRKSGAVRQFESYRELEEAYVRGEVHPLDLKLTIAEELAKLLGPAYKYFREGPGKRYLEDLRELTITR